MIDHGAPRAFAFSLTPFDDNNQLDEPTFRAHLRRLSEAGVGVYLGGSGGGEAYSLSPDEHRRVLEIGVEELKGTVPVYAGSFEPRNAADMLAYSRIASAARVDAIQVYPVEGGHGMIPTERELEAYFDELLTEVDSQVILATHYKLGYRVTVDLLARLVERYDEKILAINFVQSDPGYLIDMHDAFGDRVKIYSGGTKWAITNLGFGGSGFNSSETNVMPRTAMAVVEAFKAGDIARAIEAHSNMLRLTHLFEVLMPTTPRPMKTILQLLGLPAGRLRKPYLTPVGTEIQKMQDALARFDILGIEESFSEVHA